jgi:AbrB family looped-hinge helix DNA binding protein
VVIPAAIRKELGIAPGSELLVRVEDGEIRLYTRMQAIRKAQAYFRQFKKPGESIVDELREDRRRDLEAELGD